MEEIIKSFKNVHVLVIGDSILDATIHADAVGLSLESPTLKAVETSKEYSFGGAYNVVKNILALGAQCTFVTLVGNDEYRHTLEEHKEERLNFIGLYEEEYENIVKSRYWVAHGDTAYKHLQVNRGGGLAGLSAHNIEVFQRALEEEYDRVVLVDYRGGLLSAPIVGLVKENSTAPIIASSQTSTHTSNHLLYKDVDLICLNQAEFADNCAIHTANVRELQKLFNANLCITRGDEGAQLVLDRIWDVSALDSIRVVDTCGAGDSFLALLSMTDYKRRPVEALKLSNIWAGLAVQQRGSGAPVYETFRDYVKKIN